MQLSAKLSAPKGVGFSFEPLSLLHSSILSSNATGRLAYLIYSLKSHLHPPLRLGATVDGSHTIVEILLRSSSHGML